MDVFEKAELYDKIDEDDEMTDKEKRDAYRSEIAWEEQQEEEWENDYQ
ncbi:hypothetical protein LCGC14_0342550 [marine sediment metagenome]|uniref:Uncharacterized protein n=1 Tax=marine sediment metagenome TaxID=412755 RepID=A0A0F9TWA4_9ZZZZ